MVARKWCFVPGCTNTSVRTPTKIFISLPKQISRRNAWFAAVKRDFKKVSSTSTLYCCEDHFNIEQDMENYLEYKLSKVKARMKDDVVPQVFACELDGVAAKASGHMARKGEFSELLCNQDADSEWQPNNDRSSEDVFSPSVAPENQKDKESKFQSAFVRKIEKSLRFCTGIPKEQMDFIANLVTKTSLEAYLVCLTFYKIKTNYAFERIATDLGISGSHATALFVRSTLVLSEFMKQLVYWPSSKSMRKLLLEGFGTSFHNVQSIIDCLEIKIQKPSAAVHQSSTWSEYKQCNTIKYLISYTPDGFINFLSSGYGGSASDVAVLQDCGYLRVLPENCTVTVMIDRDFKQIENLLYTKNVHWSAFQVLQIIAESFTLRNA